jgi:anti-sigma B factor antagonist
MLKIQTKRDGDTLTVVLDGELNTVTSPELNEVLESALGDARNLSLDFEKLDYVSSAGLRVLLAAEKRVSRNGRMEITHVNEIVRDAFDVTGLLDIFNVS